MHTEQEIANNLIDIFIEHKHELSYTNVNKDNEYLGWVQDFKIHTINGNNIKLDLTSENDLFLLFVLSVVWSRSGHWENSAYFVTYLQIFDKSSPLQWLDDGFVKKEEENRKKSAYDTVNIVNNHSSRRKISFRKDIYASISILAENWEEIKVILTKSNIENSFIPFIYFMRNIKGLGVKQRQMLIKIPLILRELRCQNIYDNIPGEICCVPDKRVLGACKSLGIKLQNPYYKSTEK